MILFSFYNLFFYQMPFETVTFLKKLIICHRELFNNKKYTYHINQNSSVTDHTAQTTNGIFVFINIGLAHSI